GPDLELPRPRRARALQRLAQDGGLQPQLGRVVELLVGAAATARDVGTRAGTPLGRWLDQRLPPSLDITGTRALHAHAQAIVREGVGHEHDLALVTRQALAAVDALLHRDLDDVPGAEPARAAHGVGLAAGRDSRWKRLRRGSPWRSSSRRVRESARRRAMTFAGSRLREGARALSAPAAQSGRTAFHSASPP